jgi:galactose mutarotase-like enzyme
MPVPVSIGFHPYFCLPGLPRGKDFTAFEPMTSPTNALVSGRSLRLVAPGEVFRATFRIGIEVLT